MTVRQMSEKDEEVLAVRSEQYALMKGPRLGDYLILPDGAARRVAHVWHDGRVQPTFRGIGGSFYLGNEYVSHSGGLEPGIPMERLEMLNETRDGRFWFFHNDHWRAHNRVEFDLPCRVYRVHPEPVPANSGQA